MTFDQIVAIDWYVGELLKEAQSYHKQAKRQLNFCANEIWYGYKQPGGCSLRDRLIERVGWLSPHPELRTTQAYDVAYQTIYAAFPDCRGNCACSCVKAAVLSVCDTAFELKIQS